MALAAAVAAAALAGEKKRYLERRLRDFRRVGLHLDEATSNLDPGTEAEVEVALERLMSGRTVIVVAHRLSTARRSDRIVVCEGGRIVEVGSHDDLVGRIDGRYARLAQAWEANTNTSAG